MDHIRQALERSRAQNAGDAIIRDQVAPKAHFGQFGVDSVVEERPIDRKSRENVLDLRHLEANRIIAHDEADYRSKSFDMLRTQILQAMDQKNWRIVGITSPSPGCGKTVTAINLAFSVARQHERSAFLIDLDLHKPHVADSLGLNCEGGVVSVLEGRSSLPSALIYARAANHGITVLPAETSKSAASSAWITSRGMSTMLQEIRRDYRPYTVIVDLPPMLASDDVIALLPQLDCVVLVAAVGKSTVAEIEECNKHLHSAEVLRLVLNKVPRLNVQYYPYYSMSSRSSKV